MQLHHRILGRLDGPRPPLLLLHGLLGSSANWLHLAAELDKLDYGCLVPDLRNHGRSPHDEVMDYPAMVGDVVALLDDLGLSRVVVLGHSMGAKVAMYLALEYPERIERIISVDMAPTVTPNHFGAIFDALKGLELQSIHSRQEADADLARTLSNPHLRGFLLQNLQFDMDSGWHWRVNLPVLDAALERLLDFPEGQNQAFQGPGLFLYGGRSDYLTETAAPAIRSHFPYARLRAIAGAGHWVHIDQPKAFLQALLAFL